MIELRLVSADSNPGKIYISGAYYGEKYHETFLKLQYRQQYHITIPGPSEHRVGQLKWTDWQDVPLEIEK